MFGKTAGCGVCSVIFSEGSPKAIDYYYNDYAACLQTEIEKKKVGGLIIIEVFKHSFRCLSERRILS